LEGCPAVGEQSGIANEIIIDRTISVGLDYLRQYNDIIRAVTREQILETAAAYLDPDRTYFGDSRNFTGKSMTTILRSGIDLIEIERLEKLKPEIKARFLPTGLYCGGVGSMWRSR
jgi:hypothetical protein